MRLPRRRFGMFCLSVGRVSVCKECILAGRVVDHFEVATVSPWYAVVTVVQCFSVPGAHHCQTGCRSCSAREMRGLDVNLAI